MYVDQGCPKAPQSFQQYTTVAGQVHVCCRQGMARAYICRTWREQYCVYIYHTLQLKAALCSSITFDYGQEDHGSWCAAVCGGDCVGVSSLQLFIHVLFAVQSGLLQIYSCFPWWTREVDVMDLMYVYCIARFPSMGQSMFMPRIVAIILASLQNILLLCLQMRRHILLCTSLSLSLLLLPLPPFLPSLLSASFTFHHHCHQSEKHQ